MTTTSIEPAETASERRKRRIANAKTVNRAAALEKKKAEEEAAAAAEVIPPPPAPPAPKPVPLDVEADAEEEDDEEEEQDLEEEADEDDENEEDDEGPSFRRPLPGGLRIPGGPVRPPMAAGPQSALASSNAEVRNRAVQQMIASEDDLAELSEGLEFGENQHEVKLTRTRSNPPGVSKGYLDSFFRRIPTSEIKDLYGGGEFLYTIWGPDPSGRRVCKRKKTITIEGLSLVNGQSPALAQPDQSEKAAKEAFRLLVEAKERETARLHAELQELKRKQEELLTRDSTAPILAMLKEQRDKEIALLKEQAEREERRVAAERAEKMAELARKEALEAERRREEKERIEAEKSRATNDMQATVAMMKTNTDVMLATFKETLNSKEQGFATVLQAVQAANAQQLATMQANFQQQMTLSQQQMAGTLQQMQSFSDQREKLMFEALREAKANASKGGLAGSIKELVELKNGLGVLSGASAEPDWTDTVKEVASSPAFGAVLQSFLAPRGGVAQPQPQQAALPAAAQPVAMGVVNVSGPPKQEAPWPPVTSGSPAFAAQQAALAAKKARPKIPQPTPPVMAVPPVSPQQATPVVQAPPPAPTAAAPSPTAESIGVVFPAADANDLQKFEALIRALDAAVRADWEVDLTFKEIVQRFPEDVIKTLKETPFEGCLKVIEQFAPESVLNTAQGVSTMQKLYDLLGVAR